MNSEIFINLKEQLQTVNKQVEEEAIDVEQFKELKVSTKSLHMESHVDILRNRNKTRSNSIPRIWVACVNVTYIQ